jgi:hypothetical protein
MKTKKDSIKKKQQNATKYRPTAAQARLLEVLLNPEHIRKSITDVCSIAKCDRTVWYRAPIINALLEKAKDGQFQHAKILLTISGDYTERHALVDKSGQPQTLTPQLPDNMTRLEMATKIAFILQQAIERKEKDDSLKQKQEYIEKVWRKIDDHERL